MSYSNNNRNNSNRRPAPVRGVTSGRISSSSSSGYRSSDDGFTGFGGLGDSDRCSDNSGSGSSGGSDSDSGSCGSSE